MKNTKMLIFLFGLAVSALFIQSCGYYYTATLQGYVIDDETEDGINGATIYIYYSDPGDADTLAEDPSSGSNFVTSTTTSTSNNNDGYFSSKVIWENSFGKYGQEGDTTNLYILIVDDDYAPVLKKLTGIFSDSTNTLEDIRLSSVTHIVPEISGTILDTQGNPVNNVRLVLDLTPNDSSDDEDYVTSSTEIDGEEGRFQFTDVTWNDDLSSNEELEVLIRIDDTSWQSSEDLTITIQEGSSYEVADSEIPRVSRKARDSFSQTLSGSLYEQITTSNATVNNGISGIEVQLSYNTEDSAGNQTLKTLVSSTDDNGDYSFDVQWYDYSPKINPSGVDIPEGEAELDFTIKFNVGGTSGADWYFKNTLEAPSSGVITLTSSDVNMYIRTWTTSVFPDGIYK